MKIKEQTRKQVAGCSKHCFEVADVQNTGFEVVDRTDEVSNTYTAKWIELTKSVTIPRQGDADVV
ncbi:N-ethylammeline chlorohydrolase [Streptococcus pneumoniae]|nr:N-ethylammeline chlorohydrolase [Streptococcus pneumoniae]